MLNERVGVGSAAEVGSRVKYCARLYLNRGEEISRDDDLIANHPEYLSITEVEGKRLIEHSLTIGKRHAIAGIEKALIGMNKDGYREILVAPHMAYREKGISGYIPANAMLRIKLWVIEVS